MTKTQNKGIEVLTEAQFKDMRLLGELTPSKQYFIIDKDAVIDNTTIKSNTEGILYVPNASITDYGIVKYSTDAISLTGTNTELSLTPSNLKYVLTNTIATISSKGLVQLATSTEVVTGLDSNKAITPYTLAQKVSTYNNIGLIQSATITEVNNKSSGSGNLKAVTPETLLKNSANGVASLDNNSKLLLTNIPSGISNSNINNNIYSVTIPASGWVGTEAPYSINIPIANLSENTLVDVSLSIDCTTAEYTEFKNADILSNNLISSSNYLLVKSYGTKPTISLPIRVVTIGKFTNNNITYTG